MRKEIFALMIKNNEHFNSGIHTALSSHNAAIDNTEIALKLSEIRYRRLFESAKDGILILNEKSGKIIDVNPFMIEFLGFSYKEFIGKHLWEIGLFQDVAESKQAFKELKINKYIRYEDIPLKAKDGRTMNVEFVSNVYAENNQKVIQCNIRDFTEKIHSNKLLKSSENEYKILATELQEESARLNEAQTIAKIGSWEINMTDNTLTWSKETYRIFQVNPNRFIPSMELFFKHTYPDDFERVNKALKMSYSNKKLNTIEHRIVTSTGEIKYVLENWKVIKNENGLPIRINGTCQDITDSKKIEFEVMEMVKQLQYKNKDLSQFAYIVSHNLRAHIAKIQGLLFLIDKDIERQEKRPELLHTIADEVIRLDNVISDLNEILSLQDAGNKVIEPVFFEEELLQIKLLLSVQIKESNALITSDFSNAPDLNTVKSYCHSILYNLLSNALKYRMPNKRLKIHLQTKIDDSFICLSVKDNGMGIDLVKNKEKIFALYKRFHGNQIPGKGIGLNLVKVQIESLGGTVNVESEVNLGAEFKIKFPLVNKTIKNEKN